jgi:hypothetical protein
MNAPSELDRYLDSHDPNVMLSNVDRCLKNCQYSLDRVVRKGTEHFVKLAVTTQEEYAVRVNQK